MEDMTTRRALEICLSRIKMDRQTARIIAAHLSSEIREPASQPLGDVDTLRAVIEGIRIYASDTLAGPSGGVGDRAWYRDGVREIHMRAKAIGELKCK